MTLRGGIEQETKGSVERLYSEQAEMESGPAVGGIYPLNRIIRRMTSVSERPVDVRETTSRHVKRVG